MLYNIAVISDFLFETCKMFCRMCHNGLVKPFFNCRYESNLCGCSQIVVIDLSFGDILFITSAPAQLSVKSSDVNQLYFARFHANKVICFIGSN